MYYDVITRIKNAQAVGQERTKVPFTKRDYDVVNLLYKYGFLKGVVKKGRGVKRVMEVNIPDINETKINGVRFVSKPSKRIYVGYKDLKPVKQGYGLGVISTPRGIMSSNEARKEKVGGEYLFEIW